MEREAVTMNEQTKELLKKKIWQASLISFDIFDTLLFRKTNTPETVFDLMGKHLGIHGFRKLRMDAQNEASARAYAASRYPHADMDQIYEVLSEHTEIPVDWMAVKDLEIQMERDALVANQELLEIFRYAKSIGKRVVATSDMYLFAATLREYLEEKGFAGIDHVYCSADEHKAKFNRDLFEVLPEKEQIPYEQILHIGDKERDDVEFPSAYGIQTFLYQADADMEKLKNAGGTDIDRGVYKILASKDKGFWYNLGAEVGGPLYLGLYRFVLEKARKENKKIFFLSRDGYNLYHIFKNLGYENIEYLYTSRRALTLAAITKLDDAAMASLPPYTFGQTVGEILDYLGVERCRINGLTEVGFDSFDAVIRTEEDLEAFRRLYAWNEEVLLERCRLEREYALAYYNRIGFFDGDAICFDCGWQGSSQDLLVRFQKAVGNENHYPFLYFGIKNGEKSRKQLRGLHYDAFLFDFYRNHSLQADLHENVILYELFFSAPHESVFAYGEGGEVIFEEGQGDSCKEEILAGILDFVRCALPFADKYPVECTPELVCGHLKRLIHLPTQEEAVTIGDMQNVDGFARQQGQEKCVACITRKQLEENPNHEIYWLSGLLKRPDIPEDLKKECAARRGVVYPAQIPEYHLEDPQSIRNYHRWLRYTQDHKEAPVVLNNTIRFSVVIPVYNTVTQQLEECFQSVLDQTYPNFELILVDDHSSWDNVVPVLRRYEQDPRVKVIYRERNGHISVATNDGIGIATGDFIVFMDCDDVIEPDALYHFAKKLEENPELDFIYSDEDKITEDGKIRHQPFFKPEWSPDLFLNMMYTNHLATYRTSIVRAVGGLRTAYNGSQDYDFTLRFLEKSHNSRVGHVAKVLYHWRERKESVAFAITSKNYASEAARHAKEDYIRRNGLDAHLEYIDGMSQYRMVYHVQNNPLVSIIIPSKDHPDILMRCVDSILAYTSYRNFEFVVVDNGSNETNKARISAYLEKIGGRYVYEKAPFNFSKMCNLGAANAKGEYLLFLNDDMEMFQPQWLERMLGHAQQSHVGAVGAKLFYPETTLIQHTGVSNPENGPLHSFMGLDDQYPYYFGWNRIDCDCIGVTGACLLLNKDKFYQVGGFDEDLPVAYNDVKLCFALHKAGYYNVMRNDAFAYHYESLSRGSDHIDDEKLIRLSKERTGLFAQFRDLRNRDPFMSSHLKHWSAGLEMRQDYDELVPVDLTGCPEDAAGSVDFVTVTDRVRLVGWSLLGGNPHPEYLQRYLVVRDPMGRTFAAYVQPFERPDVADSFGSDYLLAGFECVLSKHQLRIDVMPFQVGVMIMDCQGMRHVSWCRSIDVVRNPKPRPYALAERVVDDYVQHSGEGVQLYLDACREEDGYHVIQGFAFKRGGEHAYYGKTLILQDRDGTVLEYDVYPQERIDVAYNFLQEHFLFYTGFICYVFHTTLKKGHTYDVSLRLRSCFDSSNILDVPTGQSVTI